MEKSDEIIRKIRLTLEEKEAGSLSCHASKSADAVRRMEDLRLKDSYRLAYAADTDRILNSLAYTRYIDKTQVFSIVHNDHITHRVLHVQLVSRIGRTIGRALGLNDDLIEAISLAHDLGHAPFGHDGEKMLSELTEANGAGKFDHNVQSVRFLEKVEKNGMGLNLTLQTLDGVLCHNGEENNKYLKPVYHKTFDDLADVMAGKPVKNIDLFMPMTLEGCVVRLADTISYLGRDIEDAIRLKIIERSELPSDITSVIGNTNGTIVYKLVTDIIACSFEKDYIAYSEEISVAISRLKKFNYQRIYTSRKAKEHLKHIREIYCLLFEKYLSDLKTGNEISPVFSDYVKSMDETYVSTSSYPEIVRDFIAGMTDNYFLRQAPESLRPMPMSFS